MPTEIEHDYRKREEEADREHDRRIDEAKGLKPGDWRVNFRTASELRKGERPINGDTWGPWRFQQGNLTLQLEGEYAHFRREIDLEELGSPSEVMNWLGHNMEKNWGNAEVMGHLLTALHDLSFPTYWGDPNVNLSEAIQKRYGKVPA
jgi:hypothetical protein